MSRCRRCRSENGGRSHLGQCGIDSGNAGSERFPPFAGPRPDCQVRSVPMLPSQLWSHAPRVVVPTGHGVARRMSGILVAASILLCSSPLPGQQTDAGALKAGDRVKIWRSEAQVGGVQYDFSGWHGDSLYLQRPDQGTSVSISAAAVDRLQLRREVGSHGWEGALIGAGVGLAGIGAYVYSIKDEVMFVGPGILLWALPPTLLGGVVGSAFPKHEWLSVDVGPGLDGGRGGQGPSVGVQLRLRELP